MLCWDERSAENAHPNKTRFSKLLFLTRLNKHKLTSGWNKAEIYVLQNAEKLGNIEAGKKI